MRFGFTFKVFAGSAVAVGLTAAALAQQPPVRVRGQIEKVDGNTLTVKERGGETLTIKLADNPRIMAFVKASLADIKPNSYIGVTSEPAGNGVEKAIAIHIFLESMRGTGEGQRAWDLRPGTNMTNAAVETTAGGVNGQELTVKYKMGDRTAEQKVLVPPETPIVTYAPAEPGELKAGAHVIIFGAQKQPDGTLTATAVNVGRGMAPPM